MRKKYGLEFFQPFTAATSDYKKGDTFNNPSEDPKSLAGLIEYRLDLTDHFLPTAAVKLLRQSAPGYVSSNLII